MNNRKPIGWIRNTKSVVLLGLDNAGKTTLVNQWTKGVCERTQTTIGLDVEHVEVSNEVFNLIDLGGQQAFRVTIWKTYAQMAQGVIFVFDIANRERLEEAVNWFWKVAEWLTKGIPIIFCANKIDLKESGKKNECMDLQEIIQKFKLDKFSQEAHRQHSFRIFEISAKTGENVNKAMSWLINQIRKKRKRPELREVYIIPPDSKERLNVTFKDKTISAKEKNEVERILDFNYSMLSKKKSTVQFFDLDEAIVLIMARDGFISLITAEKGSESNDLHNIAEIILSMFISFYEEYGGDYDLAEKLILENFSKNNSSDQI
jgi:ADP-ribosylation factor-like protein 5A